MKTKRTLLTGLAALFVTGLTSFAGPDSWKQYRSPQKAKGPCCATCLPAGACCEVKHSFTIPSSGRGVVRHANVWCTENCTMPRAERACCTKHCAR